MKTRDADILIIPGLGGSGPEHWQSRWEAKLPTARRIEQADWEHPNAERWTSAIRNALTECDKPVILVAHSLGVIASVRILRDGHGDRIAGAFLVAPPSEATVSGIPEIAPDFRPFPRGTLPCPATVVGSTNDPYCTQAEAQAFAADWGAAFLDAGEAGHINTESGHGPWPEGLMSFAGFLSRF